MSSSLVIRHLCILSLFLVSASAAGLFDLIPSDDRPFHKGVKKHKKHDKDDNNNNKENNRFQFGFPGFHTIGGGLIFGHQVIEKDKSGSIAETDNKGQFQVALKSSGVSAMHLQLMPNNKLIMFDATSLGKSDIELPATNCRTVALTGAIDCFAHSVEYDPEADQVRVLKVLTDPWCSSGGLAPDGTLVSTGGWKDGEKSIRYIEGCDNCDWRESNIKLADNRWYATQTMLADGRFVLIGGRRAFSYEFLAPEGQPGPGRINLPFLFQTTDIHENNLYPFVHMAPDGNLFILANFRAILLDVKNNRIVKNYPDLPGGARNYPGSASSAMLPIDLSQDNVDIEVLVCGGGQPLAFGKADKEGIYLPALDTCGRIKALAPNAQWEMEKMPSARVMGDMLNLPNGEILLINGAQKGASGWQFAEEPNLTPVLYSPNKPAGKRFRVLKETNIPRMYHSTSAVLPDTKILVAGSNTNDAYRFRNVKFPTELRVEKFIPPYLDDKLDKFRPISVNLNTKLAGYGQQIFLTCQFKGHETINQEDIMVTLYRPPFTTHGYSMNQRLVSLAVSSFTPGIFGNYHLQVQAPPKPELAPPGHYLLFVNNKGVPSTGSWIQLH
ncbi:aldehyde oxidase GLOX1-like [Silene latifolia]|uniref:aldehyde oxidase GLOX1-like n=1 Tax=Silene latifolia TaxID=37657 RepID=UPI003D78A5A6